MPSLGKGALQGKAAGSGHKTGHEPETQDGSLATAAAVEASYYTKQRLALTLTQGHWPTAGPGSPKGTFLPLWLDLLWGSILFQVLL